MAPAVVVTVLVKRVAGRAIFIGFLSMSMVYAFPMYTDRGIYNLPIPPKETYRHPPPAFFFSFLFSFFFLRAGLSDTLSHGMHDEMDD
jgi:hypothetical protein